MVKVIPDRQGRSQDFTLRAQKLSAEGTTTPREFSMASVGT